MFVEEHKFKTKLLPLLPHPFNLLSSVCKWSTVFIKHSFTWVPLFCSLWANLSGFSTKRGGWDPSHSNNVLKCRLLVTKLKWEPGRPDRDLQVRFLHIGSLQVLKPQCYLYLGQSGLPPTIVLLYKPTNGSNRARNPLLPNQGWTSPLLLNFITGSCIWLPNFIPLVASHAFFWWRIGFGSRLANKQNTLKVSSMGLKNRH